MPLLRTYSERIRFTIRNDRDSLKWIFSLSDSTGRLGRRQFHLSEFDFDVVHRAGAKRQTGSALLRQTKTGADTSPLEHGLSLLVIDVKLLVSFQTYNWSTHTNARAFTTRRWQSQLPNQQPTTVILSCRSFKKFWKNNSPTHSAKSHFASFKTHFQYSASIYADF